MRVGVLHETGSTEQRVSLVPDLCPKLARLGLEVVVERGAGERCGHLDADYEARGARVASRDEVLACEVVACFEPPPTGELRPDQVLVCTPDPLGRPERVAELAKRRVTCFALELMPRISRAQSMDVLSSMANVAGYKAVLLAAARLPKMFPLLMTAAGTVRPARVFVLGAGVAGLQAIATARRLGAVVEAFDIRADTKEQVESLGAKFAEFDLGTGDQQDAGGYAKELTEEQKRRQAELMAERIQASDVVITTAQVPGRRAPRLIPAEVVRGMKAGSVVVDMAADSGGNCELSRPGEDVDVDGVLVLGPSNLPASVAATSSQLFAANVYNFLAALVRTDAAQEGAPGGARIELDRSDEVIEGPLVCHDGQVTHERVKAALEERREQGATS